MRRVILVVWLVLLPSLAWSQAWSGLLDPARAMDWTYAGIPGGIPTGWSDCTNAACNTAYASPTSANINAALAGAPDNSVVRIPAGTVTLSDCVRANRSNVILRGAGPTQTTININGKGILMGNGSCWQGTWASGLAGTRLRTYTKGSTVLTVDSTTGLSAGQVVALVEGNPSYAVAVGNEPQLYQTWNLSPLSYNGSDSYAMYEFAEIASVDSGTQITISAPGLSKTWTDALTPTVVYWNTSGAYRYNGVENMTINTGGQNFSLSFVFCHYCWVNNVAVTNTARAGIYSSFTYRNEVRHSYISGANTAGSPTNYGIEADRTTLMKIENNIFFGTVAGLLIETSSGLVSAYNYFYKNPAPAGSVNVFAATATHRVQVWQSLFEGNVNYRQQFDNVYGGGSHITLFRNRLSGHHPNATNYRVPLSIDAANRYLNVIGNVLGDPTAAWMDTYTCDDLTPVGDAEGAIYDVGGFGGCAFPTPWDTLARTSLMRWGNWDSVTYNASKTNYKGTRWCTGVGTGSAGADAYNTVCTTAETASSDPTFPGLTSPTTTLPSSLYLAAKPSWWGSVAWPPIGPDVTGGNITNAGGHANKIPAQLCYENTTKDASGFLTAFDATVCYASVSAPAAPTNVRIR
jgi:hypothetical protein